MHSTVSINDQLLQEFSYALNWCDRLFDAITPDGWYQRPIPLRHANIFYLGHLPAFAWDKLFVRTLGREPREPIFAKLFDKGIDPLDPSRVENSSLSWPPLEKVRHYRRRGERDVILLLETEDLHEDGGKGLLTAFNVVLEHYLMHVETFIYMLHQLPDRYKQPFSSACVTTTRAIAPAVDRGATALIPAGAATLGAPRDGRWGWCNEFAQWTVDVPAFRIDKYPVTNNDLLEFIDAGGYQRPELWSEEGWNWLSWHNCKHPIFWFKDGSKWYQRDLFGISLLRGQCPAWVSLSEAQAYARWRNAELPTEAQYHRAACGTVAGEYGNHLGDHQELGNFGLYSLAPDPVGSHPKGASAFDVHELVGNGWEWTSTVFAPFPGFEPLACYPSYSAEFFDGRHYILKGASPATATRLVRPTFRNWFQPHYPYVYAKFRCVYPAAAA